MPPLPSNPNKRSPEVEAAFKMKVGDCITVPFRGRKAKNPVASMARATGFKFTQRVEGDKITIWRVEADVTKKEEELLEQIDRKVEAALCQGRPEGTREFLKDIRKIIEEAKGSKQHERI